MIHENKKNNDQIANRIGQNGPAHRKSWPGHLFFSLFPSRLHSTSAIYNTAVATVPQDRLSWNHPDAQGLFRLTKSLVSKEGPTPLYSLLCRKTVGKKRAFESLLNAIFDQAEMIGLLDEKKTAAVDATGLESRHSSRYYVRRRGYKPFLRYHWPKITAVCDTQMHLFAGCIVTRGPSNDSPEFGPAVIQASRFAKPSSLATSTATAR